jgi:hypothetical protein
MFSQSAANSSKCSFAKRNAFLMSERFALEGEMGRGRSESRISPFGSKSMITLVFPKMA